MFRTGFSLHHQEPSTVYREIGICHTAFADCLLASSQQNQKTSPKHVESYSKNKFEKLVHLVGFIIRRYWDADLRMFKYFSSCGKIQEV